MQVIKFSSPGSLLIYGIIVFLLFGCCPNQAPLKGIFPGIAPQGTAISKKNKSQISSLISNAVVDNQEHGGKPSVQIDGSDDSYVSFGEKIGQFGIHDFTIAFWVQTLEAYRAFDLVGNRTAGSHGNFVSIRMMGKHESRANGLITAEVDQDENGTNYINVESKTAGFNDGKWHHVAVVRQDKFLRLYVDGVLSGSNTGNGIANIANGNDFKIGRSLIGFYYKFAPKGSFSDLRVYDMALNDTQVSNIFSLQD